MFGCRTKTAYLTVEFVFHFGGRGDGNKVSILTHRNNLWTPLATSLISHLRHKSDVSQRVLDLIGVSNTRASNNEREQAAEDRAQDGHAIPAGVLFTISRLEKPSAATLAAKYQAPALPIRLGPSVPSAPSMTIPSSLKPQKVFYPIDTTNPLHRCLRHKTFIEWPIVDIFPSRTAFEAQRLGILGESEAAVPDIPDGTGEPLNKRRKIETGLAQLVGGYGEDSELDTEPLEDDNDNGIVGIGGLGGYGSDDVGEDIDEGLGESLGSQSS